MTTLPGRRHNDSENDRIASIGMRALIVDDESSYRSYIATLAEKIGFTVDEAADGGNALRVLSSGRYDVLVVNLETAGLELIAGVRSDTALRETYAVLLTSGDNVEKKIAALEAGYDDFLSKSATELEIVAKLVTARRMVSRQQSFDHVVRDLYGMATRDELTGLSNRRFLFSETEKLVSHGGPVTLVLFDLDDFKRINDTFGHLAGDRVLRDVGALFQRQTRPEDLVGRYGGDEFVMAVSGSPFYLVEAIAERLSACMRDLSWMAGNDEFSVGVTTGIGSSHFLRDATLAQLLDAADRDLYKNKWVKKHPGQPREDRVLPLPAVVSEVKPKVEEHRPLPSAQRGETAPRRRS